MPIEPISSVFLTSALSLFAYLFGSISAAIITCKVMGLPDPRTQGSNNPGATNVMRIGGKKAAAITLLGDMLKGLLPVLIAMAITREELTLALVAAAAFLGHLYPIFFGFKGGKGVATSFGVILGVSWPVAIAMMLTWLGVAYGLKISSMSALVAAALAPFYFWWLTGSNVYVIMAVLISSLLIWRHRSNIKRLLDGTEK
ncbi:glycerol-3-phosphate 1-O-acyltransferase PlsY [sulfur-oxidizing endosymbiont of Gigantopelta aegis]|uniref:glycerol-3-phosphate 1-O-acyltransferase PlsY n=1 Tax=sulfur-oxidizing endosymbiont of Gigantopelta aegis TaxID=2794934 RepID=UPI001FEB0B73|nr:glycerol-3-phosphate 1-O-acyltransferase PlsY [sulfur-oxidizing endosymbiont of Gigantopelta aegis]